MSIAARTVVSVGSLAVLLLPAAAHTRLQQHASAARTHSGFARQVPGSDVTSARIGERYSGPYNERIVTRPNGIVAGTDPDSGVRAYMRRDSAGPGAAGTGFGGP